MTTENGQQVIDSGDPEKWTDEQQSRYIANTVDTILQGRSQLWQQLLGKRRKIDEECDYPPPGGESTELFKELYDRDPIARRVVDIMPEETWQVTPTVFETPNNKRDTDFEKKWDELSTNLSSGGRTWHKEEKGSIIWDHLKRADKKSRIGKFGIVLLGVDDGRNLWEPIEGASTIVKNFADGKPFVAPDGPMSDDEEVYLKGLAEAPQTRQVWVRNEVTYSQIGGEASPQVRPIYREVEVPVLNKEEKDLVSRWQRQKITINKIITSITEVDAQTDDRTVGLQGTDAQYFGVQIGQSETASETPSKKERGLVFIRAYDESLVQVVRWEWNIRNPRFGQPVMYRVTLNDPRNFVGGIGLPLATVMVHWTRVVHIADSETALHDPAMRTPLNRVLDLRKLYAASAEGYWQSCFTALSLETHPQLGGDVKVNKPLMRSMMLEFRNRLRRELFLEGMTAKSIAPTVVDPSPFINSQIEAICIMLPCPKRVFMGSERGELASSQDDSQWNDIIRGRQNLYVTPRIICPFIDRLILIGVLPEPGEGGYTIEWPDLDSISLKDKAAIALQTTQAMQTFVAGNVASIIDEQNWMVKVLDWSEEEVEEFVEAAAKKAEEDLADRQALAEEHGMIPQAPEGFQHPEPPPPPQAPVKVKPGEKLVQPLQPKPGQPQVKNAYREALVENEMQSLVAEFGLSAEEQEELRGNFIAS